MGLESKEWEITLGGGDFREVMLEYTQAVNGSGNSYIIGYFTGTVTFGSTILTAKGTYDMYVAKLNSTGKFAWAVAVGSTT